MNLAAGIEPSFSAKAGRRLLIAAGKFSTFSPRQMGVDDSVAKSN